MNTLFLILLVLTSVFCTEVPISSSVEPYPIYKSQETASIRYVPHKTYQDLGGQAETYNTYPTYEGYSYQSGTAVQMPQRPLQAIMNAIYKIGFFLLGATALFLVGGIFITAICSFTSFCTISFAPLANLDKDAMRAFMNPEKIATAAALVQDAIGKYQRLQKATNN